MKRTIQEIDNMAVENEAAKKDAFKNYEKASALVEKLKKETENVAGTGDFSVYEEKKKQLADAEISQEFARLQVNKYQAATPVPVEAAEEAWTAYAEAYDKEMEQMYAEYKEQKKALCALYRRMIEKQLEMVRIQQRFNQYTKREKKDNLTFQAFHIPCIKKRDFCNPAGFLSMHGTALHDPDALFALSEHCIEKGLDAYRIYEDPEFEKFLFAHTGEAIWMN